MTTGYLAAIFLLSPLSLWPSPYLTTHRLWPHIGAWHTKPYNQSPTDTQVIDTFPLFDLICQFVWGANLPGQPEIFLNSHLEFLASTIHLLPHDKRLRTSPEPGYFQVPGSP